MSGQTIGEVLTRERLIEDFQRIGLREGDIVNVHSSMKKMGMHLEDGPEGVIEALLKVIGPRGTLVMPVFTNVDKLINLNTAPSRLGLITETFRRWPGVKRSCSATHSVAALGVRAEEIVADHELTSPLGVNSPLHKLARMQGKILHLGTDLHSCSLLHVAESIAEAPYQCIGYGESSEPFAYVATNGKHYLQTREENPGDGNGFMKLRDLESVKACRQTGTIGQAQSYLYQAEALLQAALDVLEKDITGLLCNHEQCRICNRRREYMRAYGSV